MIGLEVVPAGTEDPKEKPEVCHLTGGDPSRGTVAAGEASSIESFIREVSGFCKVLGNSPAICVAPGSTSYDYFTLKCSKCGAEWTTRCAVP